MWYREHIGRGLCPIVDTWWQTETGGHMLTPLPGASHPPSRDRAACRSSASTRRSATSRATRSTTIPPRAARAGSSRSASPGPACSAASGATASGSSRRTGASSTSTRCLEKAGVSPYYFAGDGAHRDADGYFWILGRVDDVINVSGTASARWRSRARSSATPRSSRPRSWACRTRSRARASPRSARSSRTTTPSPTTRRARLQASAHRPRRRADRRDRQARPDPVHRRPAQDPKRQDHAPPAPVRRGR
jgi:hypothetical protein